MEKIVDKELCNGCETCVNVCPKKAIKMSLIEGFRYPTINKKKCINCSLCQKKCSVLKNISKTKINKAYACYNLNDEERIDSSSGGIFTVLAKKIIKENGEVYGAAFNKKNKLKHTMIDKEKNLNILRKSKYIQSSINGIYKDVLKSLINNKKVLFCGTPCQIGGLKNFLGKDYDSLITVDFICHGVPNEDIFKKYLRDIIKIKKADIISFRSKLNGWNDYNSYIKSRKKEYIKTHKEDVFMNIFLTDYCLRESCYNCQYKGEKHVSDITLGDYWGVTNIHPELNDNKGISLVIINTIKGNTEFKNIKKDIFYKETNINKAIEYNPLYCRSANKPEKYEQFKKDMKVIDITDLYRKYINDNYKD